MKEATAVDHDELERLKQRVRELETKLAEQDRSSKSEKRAFRDSAEDMIREGARLMRGAAMASMEAMSEMADAMSSMANERDDDKDEAKNFTDMVVKALDRSIDVQRKALDRFKEGVEDDED